MREIFKDREAWMAFATSHNKAAHASATPLTGSDSYTLAAIHLAAEVPLPKTVLLDVKRAQGKFVADHFAGLRQLYEAGAESSRWLPDILEKCREFGRIHRVDGDAIIRKVIELTEKSTGRTKASAQAPEMKRGKKAFIGSPACAATAPEQAHVFGTGVYDEDDIKI